MQGERRRRGRTGKKECEDGKGKRQKKGKREKRREIEGRQENVEGMGKKERG